VVFGHSLGGHIAINAVPNLQGIKGLAISGTPPLSLPPKLEASFLPNPAMGLAFKPDLSDEELHTLAENYLSENNVNLPKVKESIKEADPLVRAFIGKSIATELINDEVEILEKTKVPVAVIQGQNDRLVNNSYIKELTIPALWQDEVKVIEKASHCPFLDNPHLFNNYLSRFLKHCFLQ